MGNAGTPSTREDANMLWKHSVGERPNTITVFERKEGGVLYARAWDGKARNGKGNWRMRSLGHRDRKRAKAYALEQASKLQKGEESIADGKVTVAQVFAAYLQHRTPRKVVTGQKADKRQAGLWARWLGGGSNPHKVPKSSWQSFVDARTSGALDANGDNVPEGKRVPVRARTVEADCTWLLLTFNWAMNWSDAAGRYLMRENPVRGYEMPHELNQLRPVATQDRFDALRGVSDSIQTEFVRDGQRMTSRSYLSELLDLANTSGRRIGAIITLNFVDLHLDKTATAPHGAVMWPARSDKKRTARLAPLAPSARAAIDRILAERPGIGSLPLFPAPNDPTVPMSRHLADSWLRKAHDLAKVELPKGGLWHPFRRKWATERKHMPDADVMAAGGWQSNEALKRSYQHADPVTMLAVVLGGERLREAK
jgi:hypothetical protein